MRVRWRTKRSRRRRDARLAPIPRRELTGADRRVVDAAAGCSPFGWLAGPCAAIVVAVTAVGWSTAAGAARPGDGASAPPELQVARPLGRPAGTIFTVAGNGHAAPLGDGGPATAAGLVAPLSLDALPAGGFLIGEKGRVREVDAAGTIHTVAGTGEPGFAGDGAAALAARISATDVAALPGGGFLIAECDNNRVRRVAPDGTIVTVAGSGPAGLGPQGQSRGGFAGDGGPAIAARLSCPTGVAVTRDGGFVVGDEANLRVRAVGADGVIRTIAGTGEFPQRVPASGTLATAAAMDPFAVAVAADGAVLVADTASHRVLRIGADARIRTVAGTGQERRRADDGRPATAASVNPFALAPTADGGFVVVDEGSATAGGEQPRVRVVSGGGIIQTLAGTGRLVPNPLRGNERRGDGGPAPRADLMAMRDVAVLADGGIVVAEGNEEGIGRERAALVRYMPPSAPGHFAAALRRDTGRIFTPGRPDRIEVVLTAAATIDVLDRETAFATRQSAAAGSTAVALPPMPASRPRTITLVARDGLGRRAVDRFHLFPQGWLTMTLARIVARGIVFRATKATSVTGDGLLGCRRIAAGRIDCSLAVDDHNCDVVATIRLTPAGRLVWGSRGCRGAPRAPGRLRRRIAPLRRSDFLCEGSDSICPPALFGRAGAAELVPWG